MTIPGSICATIASRSNGISSRIAGKNAPPRFTGTRLILLEQVTVKTTEAAGIAAWRNRYDRNQHGDRACRPEPRRHAAQPPAACVNDVRRLPIFGLGCAGGVLWACPAPLDLAREPVRSRLCPFPGGRVVHATAFAPWRFHQKQLCGWRRRCSATALSVCGGILPATALSAESKAPALQQSGEFTWRGTRSTSWAGTLPRTGSR